MVFRQQQHLFRLASVLVLIGTVSTIASTGTGIRLVQWPHDAKDATRGRVGRLAGPFLLAIDSLLERDLW